MTDRPEREVEGLDLVEGTLRGLDRMLRTQPGPTLWVTKPSLEQVRDAIRTLTAERDACREDRMHMRYTLEAMLERAEAENERLREAERRLLTETEPETENAE